MRTKFFTLILMIGLTLQTKAQGMLVYDNTNFIALGKSLIESAKQTAELLKTVEFLQEQKERVERVSSVVKQLRAIQEITGNNQRLFDKVRSDLRQILNSPHIRPDEINRISSSFNSIIEMALNDWDFVQQILSKDYFKMTDAERTEILKEKEQASQEMIVQINQKTRVYKEIISLRAMQEKINNRTVYY